MRTLVVAAGLVLLSACLSPAPAKHNSCIPGARQTCVCADGARGQQVCGADYTFGACACGLTPLPDGGTPVPDGGSPTHCPGACASDEWCDETVDPPICRNVCTGTTQHCPDGTTCDMVQRACRHICTNCPQGQSCWDPASLTTGSPIAGDYCSCLPSLISSQTGQEVQSDSCAQFGQVCDVNLQNPAPGACRLPKQFDYCTKSMGCGDGLECVTSPFNGDAGKNRCFRKCSKTADCPDPDMKCWPNNSQYPAALRLHCFYNYCAESTSGYTDPTKYFKPCAATTNTDGQCIPLDLNDGSSMGMCRQTGTAASGQECDPNAKRPSLEKMCPAGEFCEAIQPGDGTATRGICRKLCNAAPASPSRVPALDCSPNQLCTDETVAGGTGQLAKDARVGYCRDACDLLSTTMSCQGDVLGNRQGCYYNMGVGGQIGVCRAMRGDASPSGGNCTGPTLLDTRMDCADRLICNAGFAGCTRFCDVSVCRVETESCSQCDANQVCLKTVPNQDPAKNKLGWCAQSW